MCACVEVEESYSQSVFYDQDGIEWNRMKFLANAINPTVQKKKMQAP